MRVDGAPYAIDKVIQQPNWDTIDMVKHDGHLYSSKPPLLATLMAAVYWPIYRLTGATLGTHPYEIGRFMLVLFNLRAAGDLLSAPGRAGRAVRHDRLGADLRDGGGRLRHVPDHLRRDDQQPPAGGRLRGGGRVRGRADLVRRRAAVAVFRPRRAVRRAGRGQRVSGRGVAGGRWRSCCSGRRRGRRCLGFVPAVLVVAAAFFGTNWIAHHSLEPAYLHRSGADNWYDYTYQRNGRQVESYWQNPGGRRPRRALAGRLRPERPGGPPRHLLAHARSGC